MRNNKKGAQLSMELIVVLVILVIVALLVATFFLGGFGTIKSRIIDTFTGGTAGTPKDLAEQSCVEYCARAQTATNLKNKITSTYCTYAFKIDLNGDGKIEGAEEKIYCHGGELGVSCSEIKNLKAWIKLEGEDCKEVSCTDVISSATVYSDEEECQGAN